MPPVATLSKPVAVTPEADPKLRLLRLGIFFYLALWVFEGALRKWIVPGLANPLLVVRDPVLLGLYALAFAKGFFPRNPFILLIAGLGALTTFVSLTATETPIVVTLYGARCDFLHLPLIFLLPNVLTARDLRLVGKYWLALAVGMSVLVLGQFGSSAGSFLNRGAGEGTTMLESAYGHIRPSGTFSYTNGLAGFTGVTVAFFLQHLLEKRVYPRLIWLAAMPALLIMIVLSGSRGAVAGIALILGGVFVICVVDARYRASSLKLVALLWLVGTVVGSFAVFKQGMDVFSKRFASNNVEKTGFVGRYVETYMQPFAVMDRAELAGAGLGMGTNAAAGLTVGKRKFVMSEGEGGRVVLESGPVLGLAYLALRWAIMFYVLSQALGALREHGATLPLLLFTGCFNDLLSGQFGQPTELGYATIAAGLSLTASRRAGESVAEKEPAGDGMVVEEVKKAAPVRRVARAAVAVGAAECVVPVVPAVPVAPVGPTRRGRSAYAERLHQDAPETRETHEEV